MKQINSDTPGCVRGGAPKDFVTCLRKIADANMKASSVECLPKPFVNFTLAVPECLDEDKRVVTESVKDNLGNRKFMFCI